MSRLARILVRLASWAERRREAQVRRNDPAWWRSVESYYEWAESQPE